MLDINAITDFGTHAIKADRHGRGAYRLFTAETCDVCGTLCQGANATTVLGTSAAKLRKHGVKVLKAELMELTYCDALECCTCEECYQDVDDVDAEEAPAVSEAVMQRLHTLQQRVLAAFTDTLTSAEGAWMDDAVEAHEDAENALAKFAAANGIEAWATA